MSDTIDLKGLWEGTFQYSASLDVGEFPFRARLSGNNGKLSGLILEDHLNGVDQVKAELDGHFDGETVRFEKRYNVQGGDYKKPVQYEGRVDPSGNRISGTWTLPHDSGTFVMKRSG